MGFGNHGKSESECSPAVPLEPLGLAAYVRNLALRVSRRLEPALPAKLPKQDAADGDDGCEHDEVPVAPFQLRHNLEVHPVDACYGGGHGKDRRPSRQPACNMGLLSLPRHEAGLERERQHLAERLDLLL